MASEPHLRSALAVNCWKRAQTEYSLTKQAATYDALIRKWGFDRFANNHAYLQDNRT